jgi:hypothetical protein
VSDSDRNAWIDIARVIVTAALIFSLVVAFIFFKDPYGRAGFRPSAMVPNVPERELMVSRAMDPQFDSAIVGNSTSIPLQPVELDALAGHRFVSLSMSGSGAPGALTAARFFLRYHPRAAALIVALDDSWCTKGADATEGRPFPFWLYGNDFDYIIGLFGHASWDLVKLARTERGANRLDGYHPYDEAFRGHGYDNITTTTERLNRIIRPTVARYQPPYHFEPPEMLARFIADAPASLAIVLFWTPRYVNIIPIDGTPAAEADAACKRQVAALASSRVVIVDWSGPRPENLDPANFYEANHYRDSLAIKIEREIASALVGVRD